MRFADAYITYKGVLRVKVNAVEFEAQEYESREDAERKCMAHAVECLKAGGAEILHVYDDCVVYLMDGEEYEDVLVLYEE